MSESDARNLTEGLIGEYLTVTSVTQRHGEIGGNIPLEGDPETGQHRFISFDEFFELKLQPATCPTGSTDRELRTG
ncbi:hypothetical protein [Streptomyces sp. NPDC005828]|uniref:hypothetical protein n=1 Tax=Streptomyces sp. NPDC005828 TaxID=3157071 RepID=UPI0033DC37B3